MEFLNMEAINKIQISRTLKEVLRCLKFGRGDGRGDGIDPQFICSKEVLKERIERVVGYTNVFGLCIGDETEPNPIEPYAETHQYNRTDNMNVVFNTSEAKSQTNVIHVSIIKTI